MMPLITSARLRGVRNRSLTVAARRGSEAVEEERGRPPSRDPLSPRRTGAADFTRPALMKALASGMRKFRQWNQPQLRQMIQPLPSLRRPVRPLAAALQMLDETAPNVSIDLAVGARGIPKGKVVRPPFQVPIQLANQHRDRLETLMTVGHFVQLRPLPLDGLLRRKHVQVFPVASFQIAVIPKRVSQKVQAGSF